MTTNHPAHGPVSLDRPHQIREILSKAAAQSDGGNLGYAMADAVKVIDGAIATFGAEPAPVDIEMLATVLRNAPLAPSDSQGKPRAPVVPDEDPRDAFERTFKMPKHVTRCGTGYAVTEYSAWLAHDFIRMWEGWKACRAAMLQAGNSPVAPDGLLGCGENCWSCGKYFTYEQHSECDGYCPHCNSPVDLDDEEEQSSKVVPTEPTEEMIYNAWREAIGKCDHETIKRIYATMLAAAPQQEVK
ncbi:phage protein [Citrobacter freundii GTC 09629]|uniref:hypothetical protein n=1 Tax=Citrobacter freundii TaxID=546 RepID=UPI00032EB168|nr:hypothetical protein [Citrobacter freundii]EOD57350.1 phage protein [Citrobacter freundii GTC 09629]